MARISPKVLKTPSLSTCPQGAKGPKRWDEIVPLPLITAMTVTYIVMLVAPQGADTQLVLCTGVPLALKTVLAD